MCGEACDCEVSIAYDLSEEAEFVENRILRVAEQACGRDFACWGDARIRPTLNSSTDGWIDRWMDRSERLIAS